MENIAVFFAVVLLALFVFIVLYVYYSPNNTLASNVDLASPPVNAAKSLISYTNSANAELFKLYLDPTNNGLYCSILTQGSSSATQTVLITNNLPLQGWNHVAVSVQSMNVDCYLNGVMTNAMVLTAPQVQVASSDTGKVTLGNDDAMQGQMKEVSLTPSETNPYAVWQYYVITYLTMGTSSNGVQSMKVSLLSDGQSKGDMTIF